jgi:hypothetical protein
MYHDPDDPLVHWDIPVLEAALVAAGFQLQSPLRYDMQEDERRITAAHFARWFSRAVEGSRPSYARRLLGSLTEAELQRVEACFRRHLLEQSVPWHTTVVYVMASAAGHVLS